jgi:hypothetical protein
MIRHNQKIPREVGYVIKAQSTRELTRSSNYNVLLAQPTTTYIVFSLARVHSSSSYMRPLDLPFRKIVLPLAQV